MILLRGMAINSESINTLSKYLENHFQLIIPDVRGHSLSTYNRPINSIDDIVDDIKLLLDHLDLGTVSILGYCLGGIVAFRYAALYPSQVEKIVLLNPPALNGGPAFISDPNDRTKKQLIMTMEELKASDFSEIIKDITEKKLTTLLKGIYQISACDKVLDTELLNHWHINSYW